MHGQAERLAEGVEAGDLEAGQHGQAQLVGRLGTAQPADVDLPGDPGGVDGDLVGEGEQGVHVRDLTAHQQLGEGAGQFQVLGVAVGLADPPGPAGRLDLDDQAGSVRLVHPLRVQQRRVRDQDRREADGRDGEIGGHGTPFLRPCMRMEAR